MVLVFEWKHTYSGVASTSSTRDYRCQACGAKFSLHPRITDWVFVVMGLLMGIAIFPLGFALFGWMRLRRDAQNPIVPGAGRPIMKFKDGPPQRKCGTCGAPVALTKVTRRTSNGIPTGTEYEYFCTPCNNGFIVESIWGYCFSVLASLVVAGIALAFFYGATNPWWRFGGGGLMAAATLFVLGQTGVRISNRFTHPVID